MDEKAENLLADILWDYLQMHHTPKPCDAIVVLGSNDTRVAERGAELFLEGFAPRIIFSGNRGRLTESEFDKPEAEVFADIARKRGVPESAMIIENKSTNTGENIQFTKALLQEKGIDVSSLLLVQKPYMERRAYATCRKFWPEVECLITSPRYSFEGYLTEHLTKDLILNVMVGDLQRLKIYPEKGFQIHQDIPDHVWDAYEKLVAMGYTKHLIS